MEVLQNAPLKDASQEAAVPRVTPGDRPAAADPRGHEERAGDMSGATNLSNASASPQNVDREDVNSASVSQALEIPVAELRLLAITHGVKNGAPIGRRTTGPRVYLFLAALVSIGAAVVWQHYSRPATDTLGAEVVSSVPSSSGSATEAVAAKSQIVTAGAAEHDVAYPTSEPLTSSTPIAAASSHDVNRLDAIERDLAAVQQSLQQLSANQQDIARNVAALQASRENTAQKPAPSPVLRGTPVQSRKTASTPSPVRSGALPPPPAIAQPPVNQQPASNQPSIPDPRSTPVPRPPSSIREN